MKKAKILSILIILIISIGAITAISYSILSETKPIYVGVTYGGNNFEDAKVLVDKVKGYTNLFVIQSGSLMNNLTSMEQICDYAVNSGLNIMVSFGYYGVTTNTTCDAFLAIAPARWGSHFLGVYYQDEPGGKMLDGAGFNLSNNTTTYSITKAVKESRVEQVGQSNDSSYFNAYSFNYSSGEISIRQSTTQDSPTGVHLFTTFNSTTYFTNGTISFSTGTSSSGEILSNRQLLYQPNGEVQDEKGALVTDAGNISQFEPYQQVWDSRPFQTCTETANVYVSAEQNILNSIENPTNVNLFTSDYALYWYDYKGGYDTVFAELGWNNTVAQEIGLVRGAANLQGKDWGTIITWKYDQNPYLASGDEVYQQMKESYECGADYIIVFNYAKDMSGPYGTLKDEHFQALERFWNEVVKNPDVIHGGIKAEAALVLPADYGWGMRKPDDSIWGLWKADSISQQIWAQLQSKLGQYGTKLDIVYDDPAHPVEGKYANIYYWNQTT